MQDLVYWFTFRKRLENLEPPYYYIGSKRNCFYKNGILYTSSGKEYWSSCAQPRFLKALEQEKPEVKILHVCSDALDEEERYHLFYDVVKSPLFFNKACAKGTFKSSLKGKPKSKAHKANLKKSSALKDINPWDHPNSRKFGTHLIWLNSEVYYDWYIGEHKHSRLGPKIMSSETGLKCSHIVGVGIINRFRNGWNPYVDEEFQSFKTAINKCKI